MNIDLVVVSNGRSPELIDMTQRCIDSFHRTTKTICHVVCVEKYPIGYAGATVVNQPEPFCYNKCLNEGYKYTDARWICFANNDVIFMEGWDDIIHYGYDSVSPLNPGWFLHTEPDSGAKEGYEIGKHVCGWCLVVKRSVMEKIGGFPEGVDFFYSDNLYADVLRYHGIKHALVTNCRVSHKPSTTLYGSSEFEYFVGTVQENKYKKAKEKWTKY